MKALLLSALLLASCASQPPLQVEVYTQQFQSQQFSNLLAELGKKCPAPRSVFIFVRSLEETPWYLAYTTEAADGTLEIHIDGRRSYEVVLDCLIHEWAHAMVWDVQDADHGPIWAAAYGQAYGVVIEYLRGPEPAP